MFKVVVRLDLKRMAKTGTTTSTATVEIGSIDLTVRCNTHHSVKLNCCEHKQIARVRWDFECTSRVPSLLDSLFESAFRPFNDPPLLALSSSSSAASSTWSLGNRSSRTDHRYHCSHHLLINFFFFIFIQLISTSSPVDRLSSARTFYFISSRFFRFSSLVTAFFECLRSMRRLSLGHHFPSFPLSTFLFFLIGLTKLKRSKRIAFSIS